MNSPDQDIDFLPSIVESKGRPGGRRHAKTLHDRHGAMMAGTHRHSFLIENRPHVMGVNMIKHKGDHADFFPRGPDDSKPFDAGQSGGAVGEQVMLMGSDLLPIQSGDRKSVVWG